MKSVVLSLVLTIFAFSAHGGERKTENYPMFHLPTEDDWKGLRVTYSTHRDYKWAFNKMPLTSKNAAKAGWRLIGGSDVGCSCTGYNYILDNDPAVILIYAENGQLVGLKTGFPESQMKSDQLIAWYKQHPMFQVEHPDYNKDETLYTLKVYFTDPAHVCDKHMKYVPNFYYFNGTEKGLVPHEECKISGKLWRKDKCIPEKGDHYYVGYVKDMNCDDFIPFFPMYHNSKLVAFSFISFGQFDSPRYGTDEFHPNTQYAKLVDVVPDCMYKVPYNLTTLHGYLVEKPWDIDCPQ